MGGDFAQLAANRPTRDSPLPQLWLIPSGGEVASVWPNRLCLQEMLVIKSCLLIKENI